MPNCKVQDGREPLGNQDHRLSRWFALPLEGVIISYSCKRIESPPSAPLLQLPLLAAIFIGCFSLTKPLALLGVNKILSYIFLSDNNNGFPNYEIKDIEYLINTLHSQL